MLVFIWVINYLMVSGLRVRIRLSGIRYYVVVRLPAFGSNAHSSISAAVIRVPRLYNHRNPNMSCSS